VGVAQVYRLDAFGAQNVDGSGSIPGRRHSSWRTAPRSWMARPPSAWPHCGRAPGPRGTGARPCLAPEAAGLGAMRLWPAEELLKSFVEAPCLRLGGLSATCCRHRRYGSAYGGRAHARTGPPPPEMRRACSSPRGSCGPPVPPELIPLESIRTLVHDARRRVGSVEGRRKPPRQHGKDDPLSSTSAHVR
jgi:hypothetical protein